MTPLDQAKEKVAKFFQGMFTESQYCRMSWKEYLCGFYETGVSTTTGMIYGHVDNLGGYRVFVRKTPLYDGIDALSKDSSEMTLISGTFAKVIMGVDMASGPDSSVVSEHQLGAISDTLREMQNSYAKTNANKG